MNTLAKKIFDLAVLGIAGLCALVLGNTALAVGGIILVMISDRLTMKEEA